MQVGSSDPRPYQSAEQWELDASGDTAAADATEPPAAARPAGDNINAAVLRAQVRLEAQSAAAAGTEVITCLDVQVQIPIKNPHVDVGGINSALLRTQICLEAQLAAAGGNKVQS